MKNAVQNAELLIDIFGEFPTFHDAEVAQIILKRGRDNKSTPTLEALICIDHFGLGGKFLVKFNFKNIFGLKLENFNNQNVLGSLEIAEFSDEYFEMLKNDKRLLGVVGKTEIEGLSFYVKFEYCFGIEAEFLCQAILIDSVTLITDKEVEDL